MKFLKDKVIAFIEKILANCAFEISKFSRQSICWLPFYEPEQPEDLKKLKEIIYKY